MRRCFSLFIVATLLIVSSVPMMSEAATCEMSVAASVQAEQMDHDYVYAQYQGAAKMIADLPLNRLECGCGCHRSIDALPHLLAPHAFSVDALKADGYFVFIAKTMPLTLVSEAAHVQLPPPRV